MAYKIIHMIAPIERDDIAFRVRITVEDILKQRGVTEEEDIITIIDTVRNDILFSSKHEQK